MPLSKKEVTSVLDVLLAMYGERLRRQRERADAAQVYMWEAFEDELIGIPEAEPKPIPLGIDLTPSPYWKPLPYGSFIITD